ncbi:2-oxo-4-hydroxy-4-carboxy-5-ureidoimidazoline decarboxylase [Demequina muriae]|uniref:2-oxo-4-hydroxy-4-carboxy-5-ureidoimidazoline decarboxylase n=1 Tax=Demequina muriae TaxID=3051664 RepID=A0ABT8GIC0_9MICO|nr:2-oxo-4-hydroxy-4-carboxy-5-ureidoimidazoline decarboxylase [Demequina sp. EGI L300058]MDN4481172.1 2-oxo-4-hydroxy-4-carboxy-5-ureidoimidazoline decarboxylase [Demequina sp. EGI L300058]
MRLERDRLLECLRVERWADALAGKNFQTADALVAAGIDAATPLSEAEVDEALAAHPRIGDRAEGEGAEAAFSRAEQSASQDPDEQLEARLREGNAAYEARFGRVFLIRAAGRDRREILEELDRRLMNDPGVETDEVAEQLRQIAALRLKQVGEDA